MTTLFSDFTVREAREAIVTCIRSGLVPMITSSPGVGKSSLIADILKEYSLEMIDHRLSTSMPEDMTGLPRFLDTDVGGHPTATFAPFDIFPLEHTPIPKGKHGFGLFLDEFNSASKAVQAASYKLILDRKVGQFNLHPNTVIIAAGNKTTDKAITTNLSTAMQSRLVHIPMTVNAKEWIEDVAIPQHFDERIIAYISFQNEHIMDFNPDHDDHTFCCPRTWEFMDKMLGTIPKVTEHHTKLFAGAITSGVATSFVQFLRVYDNMPNIRDIEKDPEGTPVPPDSATCWAISTHLIGQTDEHNLSAVSKYLNRFSMEFRIMFYRAVVTHKNHLRKLPAYREAIVDISRYIHDQSEDDI